MQGRRLPDGFHFRDSSPGDFWKQSYGLRGEANSFEEEERGKSWDWHVRDPLGSMGKLGVENHQVEEHEDGSITCSPSLHNTRDGGYHGWLERGVWRDA